MALTLRKLRERDMLRRRGAEIGSVDGPGPSVPLEYVGGDLSGRAPGDVPVWDGAKWTVGSVERTGAEIVRPSGDTTGATDHAAITAAIDDTPVGGTLLLAHNPTLADPGRFYVDEAIACEKQIDIRGLGVMPMFGSLTSGAGFDQPVTPFLSGTVIEQQTAGADVIKFPASAVAWSMRDVGLTWRSALRNTNTGHGLVSRPTQTRGTGLDHGSSNFDCKNVLVEGHDGDHYAFIFTNSLLGRLDKCYAWGGGGFLFDVNSDQGNYGNITTVETNAVVRNPGTAHGYALSAQSSGGVSGRLNLNTYIRPQAIVVAPALTTQRPWDDRVGAGIPQDIILIGAALESPGVGSVGCRFGGGTQLFGWDYAVVNNSNYWAGRRAFNEFTTADQCTAVGTNALKVASTGSNNTAVGYNALTALTTGQHNTAVGRAALASSVTGQFNTAVGFSALTLATGDSLTAIGYNALAAATTAATSVAVGTSALAANQTGVKNVAVGVSALAANTSSNSVAVGHQALKASTSGNSNVAVGPEALSALTTASSNVGIGMNALLSATTGGSNTAIGHQAGYTATPANATTTGANQTLIGREAGQSSATQVNGIVAVGYRALAGGANAVAVGAGTNANAAGAVAIGTDSAGTGASTTTANEIAVGTANHTTKLAGRLNVAQRTPTGSADSQGQTGDIATDDSYVYVKASTGWKRAALATF